jgi:hypothetical protein
MPLGYLLYALKGGFQLLAERVVPLNFFEVTNRPRAWAARKLLEETALNGIFDHTAGPVSQRLQYDFDAVCMQGSLDEIVRENAA